VGLTAGLDAVEKRKIPNLGQKSNPQTPVVQPIATWHDFPCYGTIISITVNGKGKVTPVLNEVPCHEEVFCA
jgi:hypothetical protein